MQCQTSDPESVAKHTNALINETSPYLLQHAHNPVNWYPWGKEALDKAQEEDKLILISVGYSACHWCHVMERESFEDSTAAAIMNEHFVCIKVDREERPDIDQIYMDAVQMMNGSGGWPLNCFALSDGRPIYGGTYFSKADWMKVMQTLIDLKTNQPERLQTFAEELTKGLQKMDELLPQVASSVEIEKWDTMVNDWQNQWDYELGGPNRSPKFPISNNYEFLLHYAEVNQNDSIKDYVHNTIGHILAGGIYDQVGGGIARYSTDMEWKVPHFEKMLYDNAQLLTLLAKAHRESKNPDYERAIRQTIGFMEREWKAESGGYYSAFDADSEGIEGKYYVWTKDELKNALGGDYEAAAQIFEFGEEALWEDNLILLRNESHHEMAAVLEMELTSYWELLDTIEQKLMAAKNLRVKPGLDNKILTSWNALLVQGLAQSHRALGDETHKKMALELGEFLWENMYVNGKLYRNYANGKARISGYLEDYAFAMECFIELYQISFDEIWLQRAETLMQIVMKEFSNDDNLLFYFTSSEGESLITRKIDVTDNVVPSSNSSMAKVLFQLGTLLDRSEWRERAEEMLKIIQSDLTFGQNHSNWSTLALWMSEPYYEVAITGPEFLTVSRSMDSSYLPQVILLGGTEGSIPLLEGKFFDETTIFVCQNKTCQLPVNEVSEALEQMVD